MTGFPPSAPGRTRLAAILALGTMAAAGFCAPVPHAAEIEGQAFSGDGVRLRLVSEAPDADGMLRAALLVELDPGWKTYWIDPGDAGMRPRIDLLGSRNIAEAVPRFPAPHRLDEDGLVSNGYFSPLGIALDLRETVPGEATEIRASVSLGVCKDVCIPVSAELVLKPEAGTADDDADVEAAFTALPAVADAAQGFLKAVLADGGRRLVVSARMPAGASGGGGDGAADLFVAGPERWSFGGPAAVRRTGDTLAFTIPVLSRPRDAGGAPLRIDAVLTLGTAAYRVEGLDVSPES